MLEHLLIVLLSMSVCMAGTMTGATIGVIIKRPSRKLIAMMMSLAGGLMLAVIVFELIPEAVRKINIFYTVLFYVMGLCVIILIDLLTDDEGHQGKNYKKMALVTALGLMLHNLPEGIIMGGGFALNQTLGAQMSLIIAIHDIPEGIAVAAPLMASGVKSYKILLFAFLTSLPTAIGAFIGVILGNVSEFSLGASLAIASGIMMYVVFGELIPESNRLSQGIGTSLVVILALTLGYLMLHFI